MHKSILISLVASLALGACGAVAPAPEAAPTQPPPTPQVIIATVLVTPEAPPAAPSPLPSVTPLPPTVPPPAQEPEQQPVQQPAEGAAPVNASSGGKVLVDPSLAGGYFSDISLSGERFSLKCNPKEISFDLRATDVYITRVDFYYRIRDKHSTYIPAWSLGGTMETDGGDHFWVTYSGEAVNADNRKDQGWFDVQFVGLNRYGDVVGRSDKIEGLVTYTTNCPQ